MGNKTTAALSLDLDNAWSYLRTHGDKAWESYPNYLPKVVPLVLDLLKKKGLKITFFIVGRDAAMEENRDVLKEIVSAGHEVGNHSYNHEPWLHRYTEDYIRKEVITAEESIIKSGGQKPIGFRAPGYDFSPVLGSVLASCGYAYDSSILPTYLGPVARAYYFRDTQFTKQQKEKRQCLFGGLKNGFLPNRPHLISSAHGKTIKEIPISTIPIIKVPFHLSYLIYLSRLSMKCMRFYLETALWMCREAGLQPNFLLHPLDFLDFKEVPTLSFFPGMNVVKETKIEIFSVVIDRLSKDYQIRPLRSFLGMKLREK